MLNGPRCLLHAMKKFSDSNGFLSMLGSSTLARQDSQPLARPLVHPQNVSMKRAALVSKEFRPVIFASGGFVGNVQSRFFVPSDNKR